MVSTRRWCRSGAIARRSTSTKSGFAKSISSSDSGVENSKSAPVLEQPVEALLAQLEEMVAQGVAWRRARRTGNSAYQREPSGCVEQPRRHLIHRVLAHARAAVRAEGLAHARVQQAQKIVALGGGGHRRARIARGVLLPDGDGRRDAVDLVHVRLFHALQKLPRVGGERFHVAPLALGVDGVEGQRRFAGARHAGDHGQLVVGNRKRNVLQVVDPRAANPDVVLHWSSMWGTSMPGFLQYTSQAAVLSFPHTRASRKCARLLNFPAIWGRL